MRMMTIIIIIITTRSEALTHERLLECHFRPKHFKTNICPHDVKRREAGLLSETVTCTSTLLHKL